MMEMIISRKPSSRHIEPNLKDLKMNEDEAMESYMLRVNEIINAIRKLGEEIDDSIIIKKVLRSLP